MRDNNDFFSPFLVSAIDLFRACISENTLLRLSFLSDVIGRKVYFGERGKRGVRSQN